MTQDAGKWKVEEEIILTLTDGHTIRSNAEELTANEYGVEIVTATAEHPETHQEAIAAKILYPWHRIASLETIVRQVLRSTDFEWSVRFARSEEGEA